MAEEERRAGERHAVGGERGGEEAPTVRRDVEPPRDPWPEEVRRGQRRGEQAADSRSVAEGREQREADRGAGVRSAGERGGGETASEAVTG